MRGAHKGLVVALAFAASLLPGPAHATGGDAIDGAMYLVAIAALPALLFSLFFIKGPGGRKFLVICGTLLILVLAAPYLVMFAFILVGSGTVGLGLMCVFLFSMAVVVLKIVDSLVGKTKPEKMREAEKPSPLAAYSRTIQCSIALAVMMALFFVFYVIEWSPIVIK